MDCNLEIQYTVALWRTKVKSNEGQREEAIDQGRIGQTTTWKEKQKTQRSSRD